MDSDEKMIVEKYDVRNGKTFRYKQYDVDDLDNIEITYTQNYVDELNKMFTKILKEKEVVASDTDNVKFKKHVTKKKTLVNRHKLVQISGKWIDLDIVQELYQFIEHDFTYEQLATDVIGRYHPNVKHVTLYVVLNRYIRFFEDYLPDVEFPKRIRKSNQKKSQKEFEWEPNENEFKTLGTKIKKGSRTHRQRMLHYTVVDVISEHNIYGEIVYAFEQKIKQGGDYNSLRYILSQLYPHVTSQTIDTYLSFYKRYFKKHNMCKFPKKCTY